VQLSLAAARKPSGHGGWRPGAGRKKKPGAISHDTRTKIDARQPQHVTMRVAAGVGSIARDHLMPTIRAAISSAHKPTFRIVEFNVLSNHLHLIVEASSKRALATGLQGFAIRIARRLNRKLRRRAKLFAGRYHARALATPREVRNAFRYVLCNRKHHARGQRFDKHWIDPGSSAAWFGGWSAPIRATTAWKRELLASERPTTPPTTWLLTTGWRRLGLLRTDDAPAWAHETRAKQDRVSREPA
jgi:REP element-mobilizing transposase RayT